MAHQFSEGWDAYTTGAQVIASGKYPVVFSGISFGTNIGKFGGCAINFPSQSAFRCNVNIASGNTIYVGGWWKLGYIGVNAFSTYGLFGIQPGGAGNPLSLLNYNGSYLTLNNNSSTILATGTTLLIDGWHWIEASFNLNGASSTSTAYVDGIQQWSGTFNLSAFAAQAVQYACIGSCTTGSSSNYLDDFIIWDNSGSAFNTFPLGPRRIGLMTPNGAGASTQFTPSANANWQCVSQAFGGSANVSDTGTGNSDLYTMSALGYTPRSTINAVVVNTQASNPGGDANHSLTNKLRSGTTVASGAAGAHVLTSTNVVYLDAFPLDSSGAAWTLANVNSSQAGFGD